MLLLNKGSQYFAFSGDVDSLDSVGFLVWIFALAGLFFRVNCIYVVKIRVYCVCLCMYS